MKTPRSSRSAGPSKGGFEKGNFGGRPSRSRKPHAKDKAGAPLSQRQLRAGELVRHALAEVLREEEIADPAMAGVSVTVTEARMSPDLRHATVFIEPLGGAHAAEVVEAMNRASKFLRGRLGRHIELKFTPDLHFIHDHSFDEAAHMDALFARPEVARDLETSPPQTPPGSRPPSPAPPRAGEPWGDTATTDQTSPARGGGGASAASDGGGE